MTVSTRAGSGGRLPVPARYRRCMVDVTDATFEAEVLDRSTEVPVVVDLWASWCGPCRTLGPIIERVVDATGGRVALAKVDVDANPAIAGSFQVQSIPAVYAVVDRKVVDGFIGAQPEQVVSEFVGRLAAEPSEADRLVAAAAAAGSGGGDGGASDDGDGGEALLRAALEIDRDHAGAITALAQLLISRGEADEALALLGRLPETAEVRRLQAEARLAGQHVVVTDDGLDELLAGLLERVRNDDDARQEYIDVLERLGPDDPRTAGYRKALTARLF